MAGVGPAKTIPDAKNQTHPLATTKNEKQITKSCRVSLWNVVVACYVVIIKLLSLFIRKRFSMANIKLDQQWSIESGRKNQSDKQNFWNKMHLVITFMINPIWIKGRTKGSYLLQDKRHALDSSTSICTSVVQPARLWPAPAARQVDGLRTSSTD